MKTLKILIALLISFSFLLANDFAGKYSFENERYIKTVELNADGSGAWTYHNKKTTTYDYDEKISWKYNQPNNTIDIKLLTQKGHAIQYEKAQGYILEIKSNGLFVKGSGNLVFSKK